MKWYEFSRDNGDGTSSVMRYATREEAQEVRDFMETLSWFQCDGDGSPVTEVDTDSKWFFSEKLETLKSEYDY